MANQGIKISATGENILTTNVTTESLNSNYSFLKVVLSGRITFTIAAAAVAGTYVTSSTSITHGLGYLPVFRIYANPSSSLKRTPLDFTSFFGLTYAVSVRARVTRETLTVYGDNANTSSITTDVFYIIYSDPV